MQADPGRSDLRSPIELPISHQADLAPLSPLSAVCIVAAYSRRQLPIVRRTGGLDNMLNDFRQLALGVSAWREQLLKTLRCTKLQSMLVYRTIEPGIDIKKARPGFRARFEFRASGRVGRSLRKHCCPCSCAVRGAGYDRIARLISAAVIISYEQRNTNSFGELFGALSLFISTSYWLRTHLKGLLRRWLQPVIPPVLQLR